MITTCAVCQEQFYLETSPAKNIPYLPRACSETCFGALVQRERKYLTDTMELGEAMGEMARMRSGYEVAFARWLYKHKIPFAYEPFPIRVSKKPMKLYLPDFYLPCHNLFIEVKGKWEYGAFPKFTKVVKNNPTTTFWLIDYTYLRRIGCNPRTD